METDQGLKKLTFTSQEAKDLLSELRLFKSEPVYSDAIVTLFSSTSVLVYLSSQRFARLLNSVG